VTVIQAYNEDVWNGRTRAQRIYHLLCGCRATLASFGD